MKIFLPHAALGFLLGLLLPSCMLNRDSDSESKIISRMEHSWNPQATAMANKVYTGAWGHHQIAEGGSTVVRLHHNDTIIGTFDGSSYFEIVFQLPADVAVGQEVTLTPIPVTRRGSKGGEKNDRLIAPMQDGEITAFAYANPDMDWMMECKTATVKIETMDDESVVIQFALKAKLTNELKFDLNDWYTLQVTSPGQREIQPVTEVIR